MRGTWMALALALAAAALAGCTVAPTHPALREAALPTLVPVRDFVANRQASGGYRVSPDGRRIAWFGVDGVAPAVWIKSLDADDAKAVRMRARALRWSADSSMLAIVADRGGDEDMHVHAVPAEGPATDAVDLTPFPRTTSHIVMPVEGTADFVVSTNLRDKKVFDLYRIDARTGARTLLQTNPGDVGWWGVDRQGRTLARVRVDGTLGRLERPAADGQAWRELAQWSRWDSVVLFGLQEDGRRAWALSNRGRDKLALVRFDLDTGAEDLVHADPEVDLDSVVLSRKTQQPLVIHAMPGYPARRVLDEALARRLDALADGKPADVQIASMDDSETVFVVAVTTDRGSRSYLLRGDRPAQLLGENSLSMVEAELASTRPITVTSRDGLPLHGYLTLPPGVAPRQLPTVLLVHGGPWIRDRWGSGATNRALQQFLANRGYAVLQLNYRGSSGYGRAFMEKAIGEFAGRMHDDLVDGVRWAVDAGIADPSRVAIYGASYGGYSALVGATFTPEVFACAVDVVGMSDLASLLKDAPPYWELGRPWWQRFVGDPAKAEDLQRMREKSPLYRAQQARGPILIMHGVNDARVKLDQSERMVAALRAAGKPVEYLTFQGDGHGNQKWNNNLAMYRKTEDFLAGCLGGRSSGFDYYQLGAWLF
ncbi:S9 family peptidase [Pseudorhodoferax sp.]|uniref:S9 family peptidase n=1 Tax=Pseudorhodoferax sp. TaxID=1993553 RepID=UPI002DD6ADF3|nr:S9 family peptidase [Pseudorhodoferax sp.]